MKKKINTAIVSCVGELVGEITNLYLCSVSVFLSLFLLLRWDTVLYLLCELSFFLSFFLESDIMVHRMPGLHFRFALFFIRFHSSFFFSVFLLSFQFFLHPSDQLPV